MKWKTLRMGLVLGIPKNYLLILIMNKLPILYLLKMLQLKNKAYLLFKSQQESSQNWRQQSSKVIKSQKSFDHTQKHNLLLFPKNLSKILILHKENLIKEFRAVKDLKKREDKLHKRQMRELNYSKIKNGKFWL